MVNVVKSGTCNISIGEATVFVNGVNYNSRLFYLKMKERLNEVPYFESNFYDVYSDNVDLVRNNFFCIKINDDVVSPFFLINKESSESFGYRGVSGVGYGESKLGDFIVDVTSSADSSSQSGRPLYVGVGVDDIVVEQLGLYSTGVGVGNVVSTPINIRSENDTFMSFFSGCADLSGVDWFFSYTNGVGDTKINISNRGSDKSSSVEVNISGSNKNCELTEKIVDYDSLKNIIKLLGYGDGINQLESYAEHSTSIRSYLTTSITESSNSITLNNATEFPTSGSIWIGCEKCNYTGKTGNTLTGLTRGIEFRGNVKKPYSHSINSPVSNAQYTINSPQSTGNGSSINTHGQKQKTFNSRQVIDQSTLDILAEKLLLERKGNTTTYDPPERILVKMPDYNFGLKNIEVGDLITINDSDSGLTGTYRCFGREFIYDIENGSVGLNIEFSNSSLTVLNEISKEQQESVSLQKYMQGATNIFAINETDNCENGTDDYVGITMFFNIPEDAVAINSIKLSYRNESPKTWSASTGAGSAHTHTVTGGTAEDGGNHNHGNISSSGSHSHDISSSSTNSVNQIAYISDSTVLSKSLNVSSTSWQTVVNLGSYESFQTILNSYAIVDNPDESDLLIYWRIRDGSYYYPSSTGALVAMPYSAGGLTHSHTLNNHTHTVNGVGSSGPTPLITSFVTPTSSYETYYSLGSIIYPYNSYGRSPVFEVRFLLSDTCSACTIYTNYIVQPDHNHTISSTSTESESHTHSITNSGTHTHTVSGIATQSESSHTHEVAYDLAQQTYTTSDIRIWTTDNANTTPSWIERTSTIETQLGRALKSSNNQAENDLNLTSFFSSTGWKGIKITTNGNSRIKAQAIIKCFIESKVV